MIRAAVVEDEPECREQIRDMIQDYAREFHKQIETSVFADGQELLEAPGRFDLLLLDIEMPNLDGLTLCRLIKEDPVLRVIPVAIFSSLISKPLARKCESVGADAQFAKPDLQAISDKMYELIQNSLA